MSKDIITNKEFFKHVKPALSEKNTNFETNIILKQGDEIINDEAQISQILNDQYVNIVEISTGSAPSTLGNLEVLTKDSMNEYLIKIIGHYKDHPSIKMIKEHSKNIPTFKIPMAELGDIDTILKNINIKKSPGPNLVLPFLVKEVASIINTPLKNIINEMLSECTFPDNAKIAHVTPIFKTDKKDRQDKANYRPISVIGTFSKILERYIQNKINDHIESFLSIFISAYRKQYSSNHVLMRLIENWKLQMDNKKFVGAVLMDLSKAFDCIPHDLLIAKMHAYGFDNDTLILFFSYLKKRKQGVKINNNISNFLILLSGVPQGSILGPIMFNLFINDIIFFMKKSDLHNYADDNTIAAYENSIESLVNTLESESDIAIQWFEENEMIVNPDKFQAIIINKHGNLDQATYKLTFKNYEITSKNTVTLLGIDIDDHLKFSNHIHTLTRKAACQLNYIISKKRFLNQEAKRILIESFIMANFNYCPLVWLFCNSQSNIKQERIQKRALRFLYNDYESDYDHLLKTANKPSLQIRKLRLLALEIFKTLNDLNPTYMKDIFTLNTRRDHTENKLLVKAQRTKQYGTDTLRSLGPKIWNSLPHNFRNAESLNSFNILIKTWSGASCACKNCIEF